MADDHTFAPTGSEPGETPSAKLPAKKAAAKTTAKKAPAKTTAKKAPAKRATAKKAAPEGDAPPPSVDPPASAESAPAKKAAKKATAQKAPAKRTTAKKAAAAPQSEESVESGSAAAAPVPLFQAPEATAPAKKAAKKAPAKTAAKKTPAKKKSDEAPAPDAEATTAPAADDARSTERADQPDESGQRSPRRRSGGRQAGSSAKQEEKADDAGQGSEQQGGSQDGSQDDDSGEGGEGGARRRRRRGGRRRRKSGDGESNGDAQQSQGKRSGDQGDQDQSQGKQGGDDQDQSDGGEGGEATSRRRRRRRREGDDGGGTVDDPNNTVTRVRKGRSAEDEITAVAGSTRLEAKKQRRREGREAGRRRAPIVSEAEFLARRESVERVMVIRQREELTQIGVLEDKVLVEHYVARESQTSLIGNVYLGRVQNVLPSMEAAFIDIGKGRNAVLYAGEVNWSSLGHKDGAPRKIESVLSSGQSILVQVTKDPVGHKGARLTSQVSLAGRFLVYVPDGTTSGISRKLPDTERSRLKTLLKEIVPETAGVIVRTAAEGASEEELTRDVERLTSRWEDIEAQTKSGGPKLLYGEPDLTLKVVRDLFTEDFAKLVIQGDAAWETVQGYVAQVAPDLEERLERYESETGTDLFAAYRVDEQIAKALDRKVWLPSGGSLVIDRTEAMTVVDVNTGKFTGSGGNLEETVTKNNLEAAEEVVRQLRLRDIGGIIVVDFIDMVLESNRDLVLRRLVECLGRDRTRHQVAEVTSLGLVQMTRKRIGTGLVESFSENCEQCHGRGVVIHDAPVEPKKSQDDDSRRTSGGGRRRGGRGRDQQDGPGDGNEKSTPAPRAKSTPTPQEFAAMARADESATEDKPGGKTSAATPEATLASAGAEKYDEIGRDDTPPEPTAPSEPPKVVTRTRRRAAQSTPTSAPPAPDAPSDPAPEAAGETAVEPAAAATQPRDSSEPVAPPTVVTRTRRGGASRTVEAAAPVTVTPSETPAQPTTAPAADPAPPQVVTRTRGATTGRVAAPTSSTTEGSSRSDVPSMDEAAAPPTLVGAPPESGLVEPNVSSAEPGGADVDEAVVEHVPVRKRTRKR